MGPLQIFVMAFEDFAATGGIARELTDLSDAGTIRVVDARFLLKSDDEREDLRAAAGALIGLGAGAVLGGEEGAVEGAVLGADAAFAAGPVGLGEDEILALGDELEVGDALLLLVIENVWASGLRDALREAGLVSMRQDYLTPEGLMALGAMLGAGVALESED